MDLSSNEETDGVRREGSPPVNAIIK